MTKMPKPPASVVETTRVADRFDLAKLRALGGDTVFARGVAYHRDGRVEIVTLDEIRVTARVSGTEAYRCQLVGTGQNFSGECSCPAFVDWGFCKHLVATALAVNSLGPAGLETIARRFAAIREHLRNKGVDALVEMVLSFAEGDPSLLEQLELSAEAATADDKTLLAQFKKAITEATRADDDIDYFEMREWAEGIDNVLDHVAALVANGRAALALQLVDFFLARMDQALGEVDNSDGGGGAAYARALEIHLAACQQVKPDPIELARKLFAREVGSDWDFFHAASETYEDVLGDAGLAEYRRLANEAWQTTKPPRSAARHAEGDDQSGMRYRLGGILERFAERDGDIDGVIAIRAKDLSSASAYLGIANLCLDHDRGQEALKWVEEGLWKFEDNPNEPLALLASDLYMRAGRKDDAQKLLWRIFERRPNMHTYERLKAVAGADTALVDAVRDRAMAWLRSQLGKPTDRSDRWRSPAYLLVELTMMEGLLADAWAVVNQYGCHAALLKQLAEASENSHPAEVLKTYADRVEQSVRIGGQGNYEAACELLGRMRRIRKAVGETGQHATYLAELKSRHKAKRNFMKLLVTVDA